MNKEEAIDAILAMDDAGQMSTKVWEAMGWSFETFLRFSQLPKEQANKNLRAVQQRMQPVVRLAKEGE